MVGVVRELCNVILRCALRTACAGDQLLAGLAPPSRGGRLQDRREKEEVKRLLHVTFDLILLRKWVWFGSWATPLPPLCCCLARCYDYHQQGHHDKARQLHRSTDSFMGRQGRAGQGRAGQGRAGQGRAGQGRGGEGRGGEGRRGEERKMSSLQDFPLEGGTSVSG